jgi:hypothetical protein
VYKKINKYLQYKIDIVRIIIKYTFILFIFDIIKLYFFSNILDQTLYSLTLNKSRMQGKKEQREYIGNMTREVRVRPRLDHLTNFPHLIIYEVFLCANTGTPLDLYACTPIHWTVQDLGP